MVETLVVSTETVSVETTSVSLVVDIEIASHPTFIHQYATLMSPNKGETAVCGSPTFLLDDWGGDHWLPQIGLRSPGHGSTFVDLVSWRNIQ